ncbi:hypothetical protein OJAV_G00086330 [Oryzias javanicus]|uniref:Uncharacterized protein n=1 Tax=Oryzias javanicus TaxID=123683 RepID=A0A3S2P6M2_ORYJA|nr:hypothetical protein OJAV_G00086330 [Oryzias javanicus]
MTEKQISECLSEFALPPSSTPEERRRRLKARVFSPARSSSSNEMTEMNNFPFLELFLGVFGFGLAIMFCTTFCRCCLRLREQQAQREQMRSEQDSQPRSIYFIPFPRSLSHAASEEPQSAEVLDELHRPPRYSTTVFYGLPPSYNELGLKPDDSPPPYTEQDFSRFPSPPPPPPLPPTDTPQPRIQALP